MADANSVEVYEWKTKMDSWKRVFSRTEKRCTLGRGKGNNLEVGTTLTLYRLSREDIKHVIESVHVLLSHDGRFDC